MMVRLAWLTPLKLHKYRSAGCVNSAFAQAAATGTAFIDSYRIDSRGLRPEFMDLGIGVGSGSGLGAHSMSRPSVWQAFVEGQVRSSGLKATTKRPTIVTVRLDEAAVNNSIGRSQSPAKGRKGGSG